MPCKATIYQDRLGTTTQARLTQEEHFSQQQQNLRLKSAVLKAAARTKPAHPFLHCLEEDKWKNLRGFIISELSPKFLQGYVAMDLGCPVLTETYYFGLANERSDSKATAEKLRVIIAKEELLRDYEDHVAAAELTDARTGEVRYRRGLAVQMEKSYFQQRWEMTVRNMSDLYHDPKSKSLREIEFSLDASRVGLDEVDAKIGELSPLTGARARRREQ